MKQKTVREVTIKSFSMSKHIRRPGFQLLSLVNPSSADTRSFADSPCSLPNQERIYSTIYPALLVLTLLVLFIINKTKLGRLGRRLSVISAPSSGYGTPDYYAESDAWSPRTANTFLSPRNSTQSFSRTPSFSNGRKLRTLSCPSSPNGSPPRRYLRQLGLGESDEEEAMYPVYSPHHQHFPDHELRNNEEWSSRHEDIGLQDGNAQWASGPGWKPVTVSSKAVWSWTFVFRGRRRRMTLGIPSWEDLSTLCQVPQGRKGTVAITVIDLGTVMWPALLTWIVITWWHL